MTRRILSAAVLGLAMTGTGAVAQVSGTVTGTSTDPVYTEVVTAETGTVYYCRPDLVQRGGATVRVCRQVNATSNGQLQGNIGAGALAAGAVAVIAIAASDDT
ncbi:hypothetical protein E0K89_003975 [Aquicoccus sp. SCR17]|nr:hypothetical protein [Carideicomes alvinocaridis]